MDFKMRVLLMVAALHAAVIVPTCVRAAGKDWSGQDLKQRDLRSEDFEGANLQEADLTAVDLRDGRLRGAVLKGANLSRASLGGADLRDADLRETDLQQAGMQGANLSGANMEGLDLKRTSLFRCNLRGANLRRATGIGHIDQADFSNADLRGASLLEAVDYAGTSAKFKGALYDRQTRWPRGFNLAGSGARLAEPEETSEPPEAPPTIASVKADPEAATTVEEKMPTPVLIRKPTGGGGKSLDPLAPALPASTQPPAVAPAVAPPTPPGGFPAASAPLADRSSAAHRPDGAPPEAVVKEQLEAFWRQEKVKNMFAYQTLQYGKPRKGEYRTDGVPANSETIVYPILVKCQITIEFPDGGTRREEKNQQFVFFKDDVDQWTFRFKGNNR